MAFTAHYETTEPTRDDIDALPGVTVLEFGTPWCGHCIAAQPLIESVLTAATQVRHIKIEDGSGRRLGRSFRVKLWPTLVFVQDAAEVARVVRPADAVAVRDALARLVSDPPAG